MDSSHYLYGLQCLDEQATNIETSQTKWRYYQYDGSNPVRQTTSMEAKVTLAWSCSPEESVLSGEEGKERKMPNYSIANLIRVVFSMTLVLLTIGCMQEREQQLLLLEEQIEGLHKIYTVYPDGSQLTKTLEFRGNLYWLSPNGKHIALFAWRRENPLVALDGSLTIIDVISGDIVEKIEPVGVQIEHLLNSERVIWSPEGDKLLFIKDSANGEGTDIWLYDLNTRRTSQLTADSSLNWAPAWSPDEKQIAFMRWEACNQSVWECPPEEQFWDLVIMDVDGSNQRIIIDFQDAELLPLRDWIGGWVGAWIDNLLCGLSWSPDSQYIVMRNNCGWLPGFRYNGLAFLVKR